MAYIVATAGANQAPKTPVPQSVVLTSRFLALATYDSVNYLLTLVFRNGYESIRRFVFPSIWQQFTQHPSPGKFYHESLKNQYPAIPSRTVLKVSDLTKAKKRHNPAFKWRSK